MATSKILTGAKHIYFYPWDESKGEIDKLKKLELTNIIADTVEITQEDNSSESVECETRDEPIIESVTLGKYTVTMDSADINFDILETCMGFTKVGTTICAAPTSYVTKYVAVEVEMSSDTFVLPRVLLTSKIDASSLKTGVAKGTLSGTAYSCTVTDASEHSIDTPFFVMTNGSTYTAEPLA